jgi:hypothetical protein
MQIKIIAPPERKYSVWIGGSILASLTEACGRTNWPQKEGIAAPSVVRSLGLARRRWRRQRQHATSPTGSAQILSPPWKELLCFAQHSAARNTKHHRILPIPGVEIPAPMVQND